MPNLTVAAEHVSGSGVVWLYPFLLAAVSAPSLVGAVIAANGPAADGVRHQARVITAQRAIVEPPDDA